MNISKRKQGILAIICTIAMIVTSITVYNPREVKAAASATVNGKQYSGTVKDSGEWTGFDVQGMFDNARMHFAWGIDVDSNTITASLNGKQLAIDGKSTKGMFIPLTEVTNLEVGSYDIVVTATTVATKTAEAKKVSATATLKIEVPEETTKRDPSVVVWKNIVGGTGYSYNENTTVGVVSVQKPEFASEQGIYMTAPGTIESISINGVDSKKYALQGGGAVVYLSGLVKGENTINIKYVGGEATVIIKNENEVVTPTPGTDERTGNIVQGKIWKAYIHAEAGKGLYEISSDATNYTLKDKNIGSDWWHIQTAIDGVTFYANTDYVCTFTLKADKPKEFTVDNRIGDGKIFVESVESEGKGWQKAEDGTYFYKYKGTFASTTKQDLNVRVALGYHNGKDKKTDSNYSVNDIATFKMSNFQIVKASEYKDVTYTVSIDGTKVGSAEPGDTYTLPTEAKYGYYDTVNKKIYKAGSKITVNDDVNLVSITDVSVKMYNGAAIRIAANEKTPGGIRFKASVDVTCGVAEYKNEITNKVQAGTLITTKDILDAKNDVEYNVENVNNIGKVLDVENTGWLDEDTHSYSASLINIVKANYDRYFVAKAYVEVPYKNAASEYVYSADGDSYANSVERSISDVAKAISNGGYDGITDDTIKSLIKSFIVTK